MEALNRRKLPRSKSTGSLNNSDNEFYFKCFSRRFCGYNARDNLHTSVSSIDRSEYGSDGSAQETKLDSGIGKSVLDCDTLSVLELKVDKLSDLLQEQHYLLKSMKEEINNSKIQGNREQNVSKVSKEINCEKEQKVTNETENNQEKRDNEIERADGDGVTKEIKGDVSTDEIIRTALEKFLQSDGLKEHLAGVTVDCMKGVVRSRLSRVVSDVYLPMVERSHRRLIKHVTKLLEESFIELEGGSASLLKSVHKTSRNMRMSLERHQNLLEATDPARNITFLRTSLKEVLEEELKEWRGRLMKELIQSQASSDDCGSEHQSSPDTCCADFAAISPQQPANPETSIIDSLMKCAVINKHIQDGDINGAFEHALSSSDLSLVMAACRAANPGRVFAARCPLRQSVLLSLLQQLATDMVHDTQLKCRYLEDAIISLDKCDAATRSHLPLVVSDVHKHLTKFLLSYPKHHASRRVALIVMAVDNLLK